MCKKSKNEKYQQQQQREKKNKNKWTNRKGKNRLQCASDVTVICVYRYANKTYALISRFHETISCRVNMSVADVQFFLSVYFFLMIFFFSVHIVPTPEFSFLGACICIFRYLLCVGLVLVLCCCGLVKTQRALIMFHTTIFIFVLFLCVLFFGRKIRRHVQTCAHTQTCIIFLSAFIFAFWALHTHTRRSIVSTFITHHMQHLWPLWQVCHLFCLLILIFH